MAATQETIPIEDIKDNLIFLKDGSVSLILSTTAVNFALLFETEQFSIISSFAGLLNSLSFPIQILIISKRLDVSSYLTTLDKATQRQNNPKLAALTAYYRRFVENLIKERDVLDKQFYVCINVTGYELGVLKKSVEERVAKANTVLTPRRDHLIRQLGRIGLKAKQLQTVELIKLFYDLYNPTSGTTSNEIKQQINSAAIKQLNSSLIPQNTVSYPQPSIINNTPISRPQPIIPLTPRPQAPLINQVYQPPPSLNPQLPTINYQPTHYPLRPPFVVEELTDDLRP